MKWTSLWKTGCFWPAFWALFYGRKPHSDAILIFDGSLPISELRRRKLNLFFFAFVYQLKIITYLRVKETKTDQLFSFLFPPFLWSLPISELRRRKLLLFLLLIVKWIRIITYLRVKETKTLRRYQQERDKPSIITYLRVKETKTALASIHEILTSFRSLPISELRRRKLLIAF